MRLDKSLFLFFLLALGLVFSNCGTEEEVSVENDKKLAKVFNKMLYLSDLEGMIPSSDSPQDSLLRLNALVEKWIRDNLLMHEAERNISKDLNIDQLVRDYRASLIRHSYEKRMVEVLLDSVITQQELLSYYETNKEQYQLTNTIMRCHFLKIPKATASISDAKKLWKKKNDSDDDYTALLEYASQFAEVYMLEDSLWSRVDDISLQLPPMTISPSKVKSEKRFSLDDDNYHYFLEVMETVSAKKIAPLSYVKEQASKVILHKRKFKILEEKKEEFYERETQRNNVEVFFD